MNASTLHALSVEEEAKRRSMHALLVARVHLYAQRRRCWIEHLESERRTAERSLHGAARRDTPEAECRFYATTRELEPLNAALVELEREVDACRQRSVLRRITLLFGLDAPEQDLLDMCLALDIDATLRRELAAAFGSTRSDYVCTLAVARLFGHGHAQVLRPGSPLLRWRLVRQVDVDPGEAPALVIDPIVRTWLDGHALIDPELADAIEPIEPIESLGAWPIEELRRRVSAILTAERALRIVIRGRARDGRLAFAASVARASAGAAFCVRVERLADEQLAEHFTRIVRFALVTGAVPVWSVDERDVSSWPAAVHELPLQMVVCASQTPVGPLDGIIDIDATLASPSLEQQVAAWRRYVPNAKEWPQEQLRRLAARFATPLRDIQEIGSRQVVDIEEAEEACRAIGRHRLGALATRVGCPFTWDDLVVPDDLCVALGEFAFECRDRAELCARPGFQRLYPRGTGVVGLLTGPPGTGKTMAAQVVAAELALDLYRVDLASLVSKYIGETSKNLRSLFQALASVSVVLLFDEADALFTKRTEVRDAHDRHANADTNYLLQLIEEHPGIVLLATNKKENIDGAFLRRIRHVFCFPKPDQPRRERIWSRVLEALVERARHVALADWSRRLSDVELTGAQIKNAALAALFISRRRGEALGLPQLTRGISRELGKAGRSLSPRARGRISSRA